MSLGTVRDTDLDFADDVVIFAETTEIIAGVLDSLSEEEEPLSRLDCEFPGPRPRSRRSVTSWLRRFSQFL